MAITTICSGCGKLLAVADEFVGRQARCPQCGQIYTVPPTSTVAAPETGSPYSAAGESAPLNLDQPLSGVGGSSSFASASAAQSAGAESSARYWMRAANGQEYGPVDSATLGRWFAEGRVGPGYMIRAGESGVWQPASDFQTASVPNTTNPFAAYPTASGMPLQTRRYPKSDQSGLVLAMGILSWLGFCPIFGIVAWVVGGQALRDIQQGTADPTNRGLVQVGYYLGMISVILSICCVGFYALLFALMAIGGNL